MENILRKFSDKQQNRIWTKSMLENVEKIQKFYLLHQKKSDNQEKYEKIGEQEK